MNKIKKKLDNLVKKSDIIISSPETIEELKKQGLPIRTTFITDSEYVDKLFAEKRIDADQLIGKLPHLDSKIANTVVEAL